jgi:hypothetical protein
MKKALLLNIMAVSALLFSLPICSMNNDDSDDTDSMFMMGDEENSGVEPELADGDYNFGNDFLSEDDMALLDEEEENNNNDVAIDSDFKGLDEDFNE